MPRAVLALAASSLALAWPLGSSASVVGWSDAAPSGRHAAHASDKITLRVRYLKRSWNTSLYVKLVKTKLISFTACAIRDWQASQKFDCRVEHERLLGNTSLRLEQSPVAKALRRSDSPGWGMLGVSTTAALGAVLSNEVTGNTYGVFSYRVTLRDGSGQVLGTSNKVTVNWHK